MGVVLGMGTPHRGLLALTTGCVYCQSLTCLFQEHFLSICHRHDAGLQGKQRYFRKDPLFREEVALGWTRGWSPVEARHCSLRASRFQRDSLAQISVITIYWWWPTQFELMEPIHPKLCALWIRMRVILHNWVSRAGWEGTWTPAKARKTNPTS